MNLLETYNELRRYGTIITKDDCGTHSLIVIDYPNSKKGKLRTGRYFISMNCGEVLNIFINEPEKCIRVKFSY